MSPSFLVFHGGSGSTREEIQTAVNNGVVKMNVDTGSYRFSDWPCDSSDSPEDTQFAYLSGIRVDMIFWSISG
jgi:fructose-bisphosphate aldolase class II